MFQHLAHVCAINDIWEQKVPPVATELLCVTECGAEQPPWLSWRCCSSLFRMWSVKNDLGDGRGGVVLFSGKKAQEISIWGSDLEQIWALNGAKICPGSAQTARSSSAAFCVISRPPPAKSQCQHSYVGLAPTPKSWGF